MSSAQTWVEALNISEKNLQAWSSEAPEGKPLLVYCLEQGKVSASDYLKWACAHFELPVVSAEFFTRVLEPSFVEIQRTSGAWTPWCYPVEHWDDISVVACVEPPSELLPKTVYVLADYTDLLAAWNRFATEEKQVVDMPDGMDAVPTKPFRLNLGGDDSSSDDTPIEVTRADATPEITMQTKSFSLSLPAIPGMDHDDAPALPEVPEELPPVPVAKSQTKINLKPLPPVPQDLPEVEEPPAAPAPAPAKVKASGKQVSSEEMEKTVEGVFSRLEKTFDCAFLMRIGETKAELYRWSPKLKVKEKDAKIELAYPSLFRIVSRTLLPYHGYVVDSPAHRDFFQALNITELPKCIGAVPIKMDNVLLGILVVIGDESHQSIDSLKLIEHEADGLAPKLISTWSKAA